MEDVFDFEDSGLRPTENYGTRWISHRLNVLHKFYDKFKVFFLHLENLFREATTREKSSVEGVRRKVVSSSVILNATLFSDILAPVKDFSIAWQNNSFNIVDATTKITEFIDINKNMLNSLKHWQIICILVFIYPKTNARKRQRDLPKHKNNKLCSHSRFTYQKCNPIPWIDYRLFSKPL